MEQNSNYKMNSHLYKKLIYDKEGKNIQWGKDSSANGTGKTGQLHAKDSDWTALSH